MDKNTSRCVDVVMRENNNHSQMSCLHKILQQSLCLIRMERWVLGMARKKEELVHEFGHATINDVQVLLDTQIMVSTYLPNLQSISATVYQQIDGMSTGVSTAKTYKSQDIVPSMYYLYVTVSSNSQYQINHIISKILM